MSTDTTAIEVPAPLFERLKCAASLTHRSVEEIAAASFESALPPDPNLPDEVADELAAMHVFSDEALWAATQPSLSPSQEQRLRQLNSADGEHGLTPAEQDEQQELIATFRRSVLRRDKALALLAQRGHRLPLPEVPVTP